MTFIILPGFNGLKHSFFNFLKTVLCFIIIAQSAFAADGFVYRDEVLKEVVQQLSDKDKDLAEQLVDIRIDQEKKRGITESNISKPKEPDLAGPNYSAVKSDAINTDAPRFSVVSQNLLNKDANIFTYFGLGNRFVLGYSWGTYGIFYLRSDISANTKTDLNHSVNAVVFNAEHKNISIGTYLDWHPFNSSFRVSGGIHVNDMRTKLTSTNNNSYVINNSLVVLSKAFTADFTFPAVTPYIGIGYNNTKLDSLGFNFYADAGVMLGKYNSSATLNAVDGQVVNNADIDTELNNLRNALFRSGYVPTANFGLTYKFR
jgi:hypothetical protein